MRRTDWITLVLGAAVAAVVIFGLIGCSGMRPSERVLVDTLIENAEVLDDCGVIREGDYERLNIADEAEVIELIQQNRLTADQLKGYLEEGQNHDD